MRSVARRILAVALVLALAGCTYTTKGYGDPGLAPTVSATPTPTPTSSTPTPSPTESTTAPPSTSASVTSAAPQPTGPTCRPGVCTSVASCAFGQGYAIVVWSFGGQDSPGSADVELLKNGTAVGWYVSGEATPYGATCSRGGPMPNAVVLMSVGAHSTQAVGYVLNGSSLTDTATANGDTPTAVAQDLNGDGWVDVVLEQNDYTPNYAQGHTYWQTELFNGTTFTSTGCTAASQIPPPRPTGPATGPCPAQ